MDLDTRINASVKLGDYIKENGPELNEIKLQAQSRNPWFTIENIDFALTSIANSMLDLNVLTNWTSKYKIGNYTTKKIGLILAGNIPLVGFHDILCCFLTGHKSLIKSSSKDEILTEHLISKLEDILETKGHFIFTERLNGMEAIIATGSNHSAKQFEKYFEKFPRIIRRNRSAVAVLSGEESAEEMLALGKDIFLYFGLGCRNVSKIYLPQGFDKVKLVEILHENFKHLINHNKYKNNYDYNYALYLLNADDFIATGSLILRNHQDIISRIACLHYEEYENIKVLEQTLQSQLENIQCISSNIKFENLQTVAFGDCQQPKVDDYADGVDTMEFLTNIQ